MDLQIRSVQPASHLQNVVLNPVLKASKSLVMVVRKSAHEIKRLVPPRQGLRGYTMADEHCVLRTPMATGLAQPIDSWPLLCQGACRRVTGCSSHLL